MLTECLILNFSGTVFFMDDNMMKNLKRPGRIHQCQFCNYTTNHSPHLKRHLLTHTGERPYACSFCSYRSNQKINLKTHFQKHHRPYDI